MTYKDGIKAILECNFAGFKQEIIDSACDRILDQMLNIGNKGHWGKDGECPFCGYFRQWEDDNFCGHCGAWMN